VSATTEMVIRSRTNRATLWRLSRSLARHRRSQRFRLARLICDARTYLDSPLVKEIAIQIFGTCGTNAMRKVGLRMGAQIALKLIPVPLIIPDSFA
jgi:hypothetical protein